MAHKEYYYETDHMPDGTPDTRWQTAPGRALNRGAIATRQFAEGTRQGHDAIVNTFMGGVDAAERLFGPKNVNTNTIEAEGPMRFAGRMVAPIWGDYMKEAPQLFLQPPMRVPMTIIPEIEGEREVVVLPPKGKVVPPLAVTPPPLDETMDKYYGSIEPVLGVPEDNRTEYEKWLDSLKEGWKAK